MRAVKRNSVRFMDLGGVVAWLDEPHRTRSGLPKSCSAHPASGYSPCTPPGEPLENGSVSNLGWNFGAAAGVVLALAACASGPPKPAQVTGTIQASAQVNPSASR